VPSFVGSEGFLRGFDRFGEVRVGAAGILHLAAQHRHFTAGQDDALFEAGGVHADLVIDPADRRAHYRIRPFARACAAACISATVRYRLPPASSRARFMAAACSRARKMT